MKSTLFPRNIKRDSFIIFSKLRSWILVRLSRCLLLSHLFSSSLGLGQLPEGTVEGLNSIASSDLEAYKKSFVTGKNLVVTGAGALDHDPLIDVSTKFLGNVAASSSAVPVPSVFVGSDIEYRFDSMRVRLLNSICPLR
jgi:hypothetical protein